VRIVPPAAAQCYKQSDRVLVALREGLEVANGCLMELHISR
jgi:hypothetical protein